MHLLSLQVYDTGIREITLLDLQRLRGTGQSWAIVVPGILQEPKAVDPFLTPSAGRWATPSVSPDRVEEAWEDLWGAIEFLRLLASRPEA